MPEARSSAEASHNFAPGDLVEVSEGELMHLQGKVLRIDGDKVTMLPKHKDLSVRQCVIMFPLSVIMFPLCVIMFPLCVIMFPLCV